MVMACLDNASVVLCFCLSPPSFYAHCFLWFSLPFFSLVFLVCSWNLPLANEDDGVEGSFHQHCFLSSVLVFLCFLDFFRLSFVCPPVFFVLLSMFPVIFSDLFVFFGSRPLFHSPAMLCPSLFQFFILFYVSPSPLCFLFFCLSFPLSSLCFRSSLAFNKPANVVMILEVSHKNWGLGLHRVP